MSHSPLKQNALQKKKATVKPVSNHLIVAPCQPGQYSTHKAAGCCFKIIPWDSSFQMNELDSLRPTPYFLEKRETLTGHIPRTC